MSKVTSIGPAVPGEAPPWPQRRTGKGKFRYVLDCGHSLNRVDCRRWIRGELNQPKTIKCPYCTGADL